MNRDPGNEYLNQEWRRLVFRRDGRKCQMPGCRRRRNLQIHHVQRWSDAPSLRYEVDNGIVICSSCHYTIRNNESHFVRLFMEIVAENKNG